MREPVVTTGAAAGRWFGLRARLSLAAGAVVILVGGRILWTQCGLHGCPDVNRLASYQPGGASTLLDRYGERFADLAPFEYAVVSLDSLPTPVPQAFVAVEDKRFFQHDGVDWLRVFGALRANILAGGLREGSSTIPMQLARTLFPDRIRADEKTLQRKLLELRMAGEIEGRFSKKEILELYLNHVYFGAGVNGIQSASRHYFDRDASALTTEQAALLAGLLKAPSHYDPREHPDAARERRNLVLALMAEQGYLAARAAEEARRRGLGVVAEPRPARAPAPYFVRQVRRILEDRYDVDLQGEPLRILTTLDPRVQEASELELSAQLLAAERGAIGRLTGPRYDPAIGPGEEDTRYLQGAVVVMDALTGDILAWVGGRDYQQSRFDRALLARRQAGSAFKPFVYAAAVEAGFAPSQPILDGPVHFTAAGGEPWEPQNYSGRFEGIMTLREALVRSQNVPAVRLAAAVGEERIADFAHRAGIEARVPPSPVAALGVTAVSPLELAAAYSAFPGQGTRVEPRFVLHVEDTTGRILGETRVRRGKVMQPQVAYIVTDMLKEVVDAGTGTGVRNAGFQGPAAGKTGTTNDATDAWFVGYTPDLVGTVWIGFDDMRPMPPRATGGSLAAPLWGRVMARVYRHRSAPAWQGPPAGVVARWFDPETGLVLEDGCGPRWGPPERELFLAADQPATICPQRGGGNILGQIAGWLGSVFGSNGSRSPLAGEPDPDLGAPRLPRLDASRAATGEDPVRARKRRHR